MVARNLYLLFLKKMYLFIYFFGAFGYIWIALLQQPRVDVKPEPQTTVQRPQRDQRPREQRPGPLPAQRAQRPGGIQYCIDNVQPFKHSV